MASILPIQRFLAEAETRILLDVRSPGEFAQGHILGAISFPLFTDDERAQVGTVYKQQSKEAAMLLGLRLVGPKMAGFVESAMAMAPDKRLAVHCWRGGQRSGSIAWLLRTAGFDVITLEGGYKAYRKQVLESFETIHWNLRVLGGKTGSGKTKVLHAMAQQGAQVLDLEGLAHHKGSAFGTIGEAPQPSVEMFENKVFHALSQMDPKQNIWVENESRKIGRIIIPEHFWNQMKAAPLLNINIPESARLDNLLQDYTHTVSEDLIAAFDRIQKKLGGQHHKVAVEALQTGDYKTAAEIALVYYDKTYQHCLDVNISPDIQNMDFDTGDPVQIARQCLEATSKMPIAL